MRSARRLRTASLLASNLPAFPCRLNYPAKLHAATACRFLCAFRTPLQKLCRRVRRLRSRLPLASNFSLFTCRQQLIKYRLFTTNTSCFFNVFLTHLHDLFLNRAWSLSSALDAFSCKQSLIFSCRQQLILSAFIDVNFGESVVCLVFST